MGTDYHGNNLRDGDGENDRDESHRAEQGNRTLSGLKTGEDLF